MGQQLRLLLLLMIGCGSSSLGCATTPYRYGRFAETIAENQPPPEIQFEQGKPNKFLDGMSWVIGFPTRILPMSPKVNNHEFTEETCEKLTAYMQDNDLGDVLVRVNQYDPIGEWKRLCQNDRISPGWKFTFGTAGLINYTLLPCRVFGGDIYNPFTNSLYVNSDVPALLISEAAYAKDIHARRLPGPYASVNELPVLALWRYTHAVNDTLGYAQLNNDWEVERETYRVVYPIMGIQVALGGHSALSLRTGLPMITVPITALGGAIAGHTYGQSTIAKRERERQETGVLGFEKEDDDSSGYFHGPLPLAGESSQIQLTGAVEDRDVRK